MTLVTVYHGFGPLGTHFNWVVWIRKANAWDMAKMQILNQISIFGIGSIAIFLLTFEWVMECHACWTFSQQEIYKFDRHNFLMLFYLSRCNGQCIAGNIVVKTKIFMSISIFRLATTMSSIWHIDWNKTAKAYVHLWRAHVLIVLVTASDKTVFSCHIKIDTSYYGGSY